MTKMNPEVKAKWLTALRSGEYKQGDKRLLCDGNGGWCCLGVLCDLYAKEKGLHWQHGGEGMFLRTGEQRAYFYPGDPVREWASFHEDEQRVEINGFKESVAVHNDGICRPRATFSEIADAIEEQL